MPVPTCTARVWGWQLMPAPAEALLADSINQMLQTPSTNSVTTNQNPRISFTISPARQTTHALGRNNMRSAERRDSIEFAAAWAPHRYLHCSSHQYYSTCTSTLAQAQPPWEAMHPLTGSRSCATYLVLQHKYTLS